METPFATFVTVVLIVAVIAVIWGAFHCHSFGLFTACF